MKFEENIEYLIVSYKEYNSFVLKYKRLFPILNISFIDVNQFKKNLTFSYDEKTISYLLSLLDSNNNHLFDYVNAKKFLNLVFYINEENSKNDEELLAFFKIKQDLIKKNLLFFDKLYLNDYKCKKIILIDLEDDFNLKYLLDKYDFKYESLDIDFFLKEKNKINKVINFDSIFEQLNYVFNDICKIIDIDNYLGKINIICDLDKYQFYLDYFSKSYNIPINYEISVDYKNLNNISQFLNQLYLNKTLDINAIDYKDNDYINKIKDIIRIYNLDKYEFTYSFNVLNQILSSIKIIQNVNNNGINVVSTSINYKEDTINYFLDFLYERFPKNYEENELINDEQLLKINLNPSYIKYKLELKKTTNFIKNGNIKCLSYVKSYVGQQNYISNLAKLLNLKDEEYIRNDDEIFDYSIDASKLNYKLLKDEFCQFDKSNDFYFTYKNIFGNKNKDTFINDYKTEFKWNGDKPQIKNNKYSVSSIEEYSNCPFLYYLKRILKIQLPFDNDFGLRIGNFCHKVLEHIYNNDFDFDTECEQIKDLYFISNIEKLLYKNIKISFLNTINFILENKYILNLNKKNIFSEYKRKIYIDNYEFDGRIDLIFISENNDLKFLNIIDYKTYDKGFDYKKIKYGINLQLPTYMLLIDSDKEFEKYQIGGAYIQKILSKDLLMQDEKLLITDKKNDEFKFSGIRYENNEYLNSLSTSELFKKSSKNFKNKGIKKGDILNTTNFKVEIEDGSLTLEKILQDTKTILLKKIKQIENFDFKIAPLSETNGDNKICENCLFIDVCHNKESGEYINVICTSDLDEEELLDE